MSILAGTFDHNKSLFCLLNAQLDCVYLNDKFPADGFSVLVLLTSEFQSSCI